MTVEEYWKVYEKYNEMFNEDMLCTLPGTGFGPGKELYKIMKDCIAHGKDAVDMGYSDCRAGCLQHKCNDGTIEYYDA